MEINVNKRYKRCLSKFWEGPDIKAIRTRSLLSVIHLTALSWAGRKSEPAGLQARALVKGFYFHPYYYDACNADQLNRKINHCVGYFILAE